jgi:ParB-like chromosome segregation protein Spo0J
VVHVDASSFQLARKGDIAVAAVSRDGRPREVATIAVLSLRAGESPRLAGEDKAHIARLAESESALPPILVDRRTMRVIDGMHRLLAASLNGRETIEVEFFDGTTADAFLKAVEANVTHGLPLSQADRRAAAARIIVSHPYMSDRAIGASAGLAAKTVAAIRRHSSAEASQLSARVGRDGKVRPLDGVAGRRRVAELMAQRPRASLREIARAAGVSPATAGDVRRRLARGEEPASSRASDGAASAEAAGRDGSDGSRSRGLVRLAPAMALAKLLRDPSLRHNEQGRWLLRLLQHNAVGAREWSGAIDAVPPHCTVLMVQLARQYAQMWLCFAQELDERARVIDPRAARRVNGRT